MKNVQKERFVLEETGERIWQNNLNADHDAALCSTLEDLCVCWLQKKYAKVKKSTFFTYRYCIEKHIIPLLGHCVLAELKEETILTFIEKLQEKELADSTIHSVLLTLKIVLRIGNRTHLVDETITNCCTFSHRRTESRILSIQDSARMRDYLLDQNTIFAIGILLCRSTGIRIGELCGLKWEDIDLSEQTFHIRRTVSRIPNPDVSDGKPKTVLYVRTPKSSTSSREIPIPQYLIGPLTEMRCEGKNYLLTGRDTCTEPRNVQKKFKTILKHCEMQDCNFHAMRHGFATECLEKGVDCKTVSSILGHASTRTTMDFYVHTSMRQKQNCVNLIE